MKMMRRFVLGALVFFVLGAATAEAHGFWSVGIRIGIPIGYPCCGYYYRPYYPVYVAPPPVYVAPAPVYVQPAPAVAQPTNPLPSQPAPVQARYTEEPPMDVDRFVHQLADADERTRIDAVQQLGRQRSARALDPLAATLAGDRSPAVREASARALGLIGAPQSLPALQRAAQVDTDHDVRHSAQFAAEVIQSNQTR